MEAVIINKQDNTEGAIQINSVQANSVYCVNNGVEKSFLDKGNAVINDSIFSRYMRKHGVDAKKGGRSLDLLVMKFDYGTKSEKVGDKTIAALSSKELRKLYYKNGVTVNWNKTDKDGNVVETIKKSYKMLMRSPGKAKEGECIFIDENLHKNAMNYITMGLYDKMPKDNAPIVELAAYSTLITATAIDYITLSLDNMFIVKDEESSVLKKALEVKVHDVEHFKRQIDFTSEELEEYLNNHGLTFYKRKLKKNPSLKYVKKSKKALEENGISLNEYPMKEIPYMKKECYVDRSQEELKVTNILWDGMGLIDESIFPDNMEGFIYCRSHFFKSCLFRGNIQEYFKDYYGDRYDTAVEMDMLGREMKVTDIKWIVTENSLKWMKFIDLMGGTYKAAFDYYRRFMEKQGQVFSIVKTAHASKWGELQRSSYQMNGSLPTDDPSVLLNIATRSIEYCNNLKINETDYLEYLRVTAAGQHSINNVLIALNEWNENFKYTKYYKDKKYDIISRFKKERLQLGKLLQHGDNLTICGNPIALLMKVCGENPHKEDIFKKKDDCIQCYTTRFKAGEHLAGFRSPHNAPNNIVHLENIRSTEISKYFPKLGDNVIIINGIETDVQSHLNGQDLDSDAIYATNQEDMVDLAKKAYLNYPTIVNGIGKSQSEYKKDMESYAEMDSAISAAQYAIGYASNIAQLALSYYYDSGSNNKELEDVFVICSVLAQVAIDSAKRNFEIQVLPELKRISELACMQRSPRYPRFYAEIQKLKNRNKVGDKKVEINPEDVGDLNCPMDILYQIIDENIIDLRKQKEMNTRTVNLRMVFEYDPDKMKNKNRRQYKDIISMVEECDEKILSLNRESDNYHEQRRMVFEQCLSKVKRKHIKEETMYTLIAYAFRIGGSMGDRLLTVLYDLNHDEFLKNFKK